MILKMSNYAQFKKTGDTWYSTPFYSRWSECRLCLRVRPSQAQGIHSWRQPQNPNVIVSHHHQSEGVGVALELLSSPIPHNFMSLTVELLNQASDAAHMKCNIIPSRSTSLNSRIREEGIAKSDDFDLPVQSTHPQVQYLQNDCLLFRVSEDEGLKPWLVDPMPRSDWKQPTQRW